MELERDVEQYLVRRVTALGGVCLKHGKDGWPDRICMLPGGLIVWVETKRREGKLSNLQVVRAAQLAKVGQSVLSVWSKEEVDELLGQMMDE